MGTPLQMADPEKEEEDLRDLRHRAAYDEAAIMSPFGIDGAVIEYDNDLAYINVYTDGSCSLAQDDQYAHAGWGITLSLDKDGCSRCGPV